MEKLLQQLSNLSSDLIAQLDSCTVDEIEEYMEQREQIYVELRAMVDKGVETTDEVSALAYTLRSQDATIVARLKELRREAAVELGRINQGKRSRQAYDTSAGSDDGLFFDTRH